MNDACEMMNVIKFRCDLRHLSFRIHHFLFVVKSLFPNIAATFK